MWVEPVGYFAPAIRLFHPNISEGCFGESGINPREPVIRARETSVVTAQFVGLDEMRDALQDDEIPVTRRAKKGAILDGVCYNSGIFQSAVTDRANQQVQACTFHKLSEASDEQLNSYSIVHIIIDFIMNCKGVFLCTQSQTCLNGSI